MTARTLWPADRWPSADEWREWFLSLDAPAQHDAATMVVANAQAAASCTDLDHSTAYNRGWRDGQCERKAARSEYTGTEPAR